MAVIFAPVWTGDDMTALNEIKTTARMILAMIAASYVLLIINHLFPWTFEYHVLKSNGQIGHVFGTPGTSRI